MKRLDTRDLQPNFQESDLNVPALEPQSRTILESFFTTYLKDKTALKVPLKAKIVQNLFSQIHKKYGKYTFETFTVDRISILIMERSYHHTYPKAGERSQ
jgi:hypothetical protein